MATTQGTVSKGLLCGRSSVRVARGLLWVQKLCLCPSSTIASNFSLAWLYSVDFAAKSFPLIFPLYWWCFWAVGQVFNLASPQNCIWYYLPHTSPLIDLPSLSFLALRWPFHPFPILGMRRRDSFVNKLTCHITKFIW